MRNIQIDQHGFFLRSERQRDGKITGDECFSDAVSRTGNAEGEMDILMFLGKERIIESVVIFKLNDRFVDIFPRFVVDHDRFNEPNEFIVTLLLAKFFVKI